MVYKNVSQNRHTTKNISTLYYSARISNCQFGFLDTTREILFNKACAVCRKTPQSTPLVVCGV